MKKILIFLFIFYIPIIFAKEKLALSDYGVKFLVFDHWEKQNNNFYQGIDGTSINLQLEENLMDLETYGSYIEDKFLKSYPDFKTSNKLYKNVSKHRALILKSNFSVKLDFNSVKMESCIIIFNFYNEKLVFIVSYPYSIKGKIAKYISKLEKKIILPKKYNLYKDKTNKKADLIIYKNNKEKYQVLIPSDFIKKEDGFFISENSDFILVNKEKIEDSIEIYLQIYIKKLKKTQKNVSIIDKRNLRINGFEVIELQIKKDKKELLIVFYKKQKQLYILTTSCKNPNLNKIKKSFKSLKNK